MRPDSIDSLQPYLRNSFASHALALGESTTMIGKLLGHNDIETTARYAHLAPDSVHEAGERIADSIATDILLRCRPTCCVDWTPAVLRR